MPIFSLVEIGNSGLVAVASLDKMLTIWDFHRSTLVNFVDCKASGLLQMAYFNTYQLLLTSGFTPYMSAYSVSSTYYDSTFVGKLQGHTSLVMAFAVLEKSPVVVSIDNQSCVKA